MKKYQHQDEVRCPFSQQLLNATSDRSFVCLGAQRAVRTKNVGILSLDTMSAESAEALVINMNEWIQEVNYAQSFSERNFKFASFVAVFSKESFGTEDEAEAKLWSFLSQVHIFDAVHNTWDENFSKNVYDTSFAFSIAGHGHFVPLLHPKASSLVRRTQVPTLVFNPHCMFQQMKKLEFFDSMRNTIRAREYQAQSWINPKLSNAGECFEAPQYALTSKPVFNIGPCPFTRNMPLEFPKYRM